MTDGNQDLRSALPEVAAWWDSLEGNLPSDELNWHLIAIELVDRARDGRLPDLRALSPSIERALEIADDKDQVTLGFIETLKWRATEAHLEPSAIAVDLGPRARATWDLMYRQDWEDDLRPLAWTSGDIDALPEAPLQLHRWNIRTCTWVAPLTPIAELLAGSVRYQLQCVIRTYVDRLAAAPGIELNRGDLVAYIAFENPQALHGRPPCVLVPVAA